MVAFAPGMLLMGLNDLYIRLLIQLGMQQETMKINCYGAVVHILGNYIFVVWMKYGVVGSGLACTVTNLFIYIVLDNLF